MSSWSLTAVSTDDVEARLSSFLPALCMTRNATKFPKWNVATVEKAFKWADYLEEVSRGADQVQKESIVRKGLLKGTGIDVVNKDPMLVLLDPVESLMRAILTSPYLAWAQDAVKVLKKALESTAERKGEEACVRICVSSLESTLSSRISLSNGTCLGQKQESNSDEEALAFELLVALASPPSPSISQVEKEKLIAKAAKEDLVTFKMLCSLLIMSPARVACLTSLHRGAESWERLYAVSKGKTLVGIVKACIRDDYPRYLYLLDTSADAQDANHELLAAALSLHDVNLEL